MSNLPTEGRAAGRLDTEPLAWLTTVSSGGSPQSSPIWFVVHGGAIYLQSEPTAGKLRNISRHPQVSFHLESDGFGGDIVTVEAKAEALDTTPAGVLEAYLAKYGQLIKERMNTTPESLAAQFSTTVRLTPERIRAW